MCPKLNLVYTCKKLRKEKNMLNVGEYLKEKDKNISVFIRSPYPSYS